MALHMDVKNTIQYHKHVRKETLVDIAERYYISNDAPVFLEYIFLVQVRLRT